MPLENLHHIVELPKKIIESPALIGSIAATTGISYGARYERALQIEPNELKRYYKKIIYLAAEFAGFAQTPTNRDDASLSHQARAAGKAAFFSCAFDVASDWGKSTMLHQTFQHVLEAETSPRLTDMAMDLFNRDIAGELLYDGLERGIIATHFVLDMMGIKEKVKDKMDVDELGIILQIIDDVLDLPDDLAAGDQNCLTTLRRNEYLLQFLQGLDAVKVQQLFPYAGLLAVSINIARTKARQILHVQSTDTP